MVVRIGLLMALQVYIADANIPRPDYLGGGNWNLTGLSPITILFGKNSSGKSLLLRAWRNANEEETHYVIPERIGNLQFNPNYLSQEIDAHTRREQHNRNYINEYRERVISRIQGYFLTRGATRSAKLPGDPAELESLASILLPDFLVELIASNPPHKLTRSENGQVIGDVQQLSTGEAQVLTIGLDILSMAAIWDIQGADQRLMLVDEPDAHIHPDLQARFAHFLVQVGHRFSLQIVVASHSTTLLAALGHFGDDDAAVIYLDRTKSSFVAQRFTDNLKELAACLGGHALMGPLFGVPLLLVEGDDDYRIWSQVPRHHTTTFAVIPCKGEEIKKYQRTLEQVFNSLREVGNQPAGYALLDGDKGQPQPSPDAPQNHVRFLCLNCHESENLYVCDETLALLDTDWDQASAKISAESVNFGEKKSKLASAPSWDRQWEDLKDVIDAVAQILDTKNLHWTVRVGKAIGGCVPTGQLRGFLGEAVVAALWKAQCDPKD